MARPRAARSQRERLLVASPRRVRHLKGSSAPGKGDLDVELVAEKAGPSNAAAGTADHERDPVGQLLPASASNHSTSPRRRGSREMTTNKARL
jgi:hypothetical protein